MAERDVFSRLKKLFSSSIIIRNIGGDQIKVVDINSIQQGGDIKTNSLIDRFNRIYTTNPSSLYGSQFNQNYKFLRPQLYSEYDTMDLDAIVASSLDIMADEATLKNDVGEILQIRSSNDDIQQILYNLFYDVLNIEFNLWSWIRQMCKYGDFFLKLEIAEKYGVYNILPYTAYHIERQEAYDLSNPSAVRFKYSPEGIMSSGTGMYTVPSQNVNDNNGIYFDNYEMAHFRLISDVNYLPYGRSIIEPGRKLFKQYTLMEDAMLIHRISRAPEKRIFYINVGGIPANEVEAFMQKTISNMKRTPYINKETGDYNLKYNMQNMLEDFYIPVRGNDTATKIETAKGLEYTGLEDVTYLRDKLFAALKVPRAFMGYTENLQGKSTLAAQDIRFARTIERIQRIMIAELNRIALVHLYAQGYRDETLTNFELSLTTPSIIYDQERIELMKSKAELSATILEQSILPTDWIYDNIYHLSEDQFDEMRDLIREDAKRKFRLTQIENEGNDPQESGKSYGTPHDLASLYGKGRMYTDAGNVPQGYSNTPDLGRPQESITTRGKQEDNFGKDRLGVLGMKDKDKNESDSIRPSYKGNGPLALEGAKKAFIQNQKVLAEMDKFDKKIMIFEQDDNISFLDEKQLED